MQISTCFSKGLKHLHIVMKWYFLLFRVNLRGYLPCTSPGLVLYWTTCIDLPRRSRLATLRCSVVPVLSFLLPANPTTGRNVIDPQVGQESDVTVTRKTNSGYGGRIMSTKRNNSCASRPEKYLFTFYIREF